MTQAKKFLGPQTAMRFIVLMGVVSLFADVTYEGARSITGPFLATLQANAVVVGFVAGGGELVGYCLRLVTGYISDRTGRYWLMTILGYSINVLAVPLIALAGNWPLAAALMIAERAGKAIRSPARDAMLSYATQQVGRGWGFAVHEALDQIGAILGPCVVAAVLYFRGDYSLGFGVLLIPAVLAIAVLAATRMVYPRPRDLETVQAPKTAPRGFPKVFWIYLLAVLFIAAGFVDFPLMAYHFQKTLAGPKIWIPIFYSVAMAADALSALFFGRLFDRIGLAALTTVTFVSLFFAPLVFLGNFQVALLGMVFWGIGMGAQESVMRAAISEMVPSEKRATAYGVFNTGYGIAWFLGSVLMGFLYEQSLSCLVLFSIFSQLLALPVFWRVSRMRLQDQFKTESAGGVVTNAKGEVLVVSQNGNSWSLPKGHLNKGEDALAAAKREIFEESGLRQLHWVKKLGRYERYRIGKDGGEDDSELKAITLFLFRTDETALNPHDPDNPEARWVPKDRVADLLTHPRDKEFFLQILKELP